MGDFLSQAEIDALLGGTSQDSSSESTTNVAIEDLTEEEKDALGEICNMSMGASATALFQILGQKVNITTPQVSLVTWDDIGEQYSESNVCVKIEYTEGISGSNIMVLKEEDVKVITDIMMGGDGSSPDVELTDLHLSAISEAMNQMIGSSSTALSGIFNEKIDITPPKASMFRFEEAGMEMGGLQIGDRVAKVSFRMLIGDLIDSSFVQIFKLGFAKSLVEKLMAATYASMNDNSQPEEIPVQKEEIPPSPQPMVDNHQNVSPPPVQEMPQMGMHQNPTMQQNMGYQQNMGHPPNMGYPQNMGMFDPSMMNMGYVDPNMQMTYAQQQRVNPVNVHHAQFQAFEEDKMLFEKKNIDLIMDVGLQVTVELGRTSKFIKEILEFGNGTIVELDKLTEEPVDILVNGKMIAKGEVVVVDEKFGVRITEIVHPSKRL